MEKVIKIRKLNFSYPDGTPALRNIDLDVFKGESLGIIGPNGAGKSTLLLHLNGILRGSGEMSIMGLPVDERYLQKIRSKVGLVFQEPDNQLFMPTVFDDVSFGPINLGAPKQEVLRKVEEALNRVGMNYATMRSSHHLSVGEKRKVSLATILSMDPEIIIMDEPTSNLDPKARRELITLLKNINKTKIIASHDLEMIFEICERVLVLDGGQTAEIAPVAEISRDRTLLATHNLIFIRGQEDTTDRNRAS